MNQQLSFGIERDVLVDELQYHSEQQNAAEKGEEEFTATDTRRRDNLMLRHLEGKIKVPFSEN